MLRALAVTKEFRGRRAAPDSGSWLEGRKCGGLRRCSARFGGTKNSGAAAVQHSSPSSVYAAKRCHVGTRHRSGRAFRPRIPVSGVGAIADHSTEVSVLHRAGVGFSAAATRCHALSVGAKLGRMCSGFQHCGSTQAMASANKPLHATCVNARA